MVLVNPEPTPLDFRVEWPTDSTESLGSTDPESPSLLFASDQQGLTWVHLQDGRGAAIFGTLPAMATAVFVGGGECSVFDAEAQSNG